MTNYFYDCNNTHVCGLPYITYSVPHLCDLYWTLAAVSPLGIILFNLAIIIIKWFLNHVQNIVENFHHRFLKLNDSLMHVGVNSSLILSKKNSFVVCDIHPIPSIQKIAATFHWQMLALLGSSSVCTFQIHSPKPWCQNQWKDPKETEH